MSGAVWEQSLLSENGKAERWKEPGSPIMFWAAELINPRFPLNFLTVWTAELRFSLFAAESIVMDTIILQPHFPEETSNNILLWTFPIHLQTYMSFCNLLYFVVINMLRASFHIGTYRSTSLSRSRAEFCRGCTLTNVLLSVVIHGVPFFWVKRLESHWQSLP